MKPELRRCHAVEMNLRTIVVLTEEDLAKIASISKPDREGDSLFVDTYPGHRAWVWVKKPKKTKRAEKECELEFTFEPTELRRVGKRVPHIDQLMDILASSRKTYDFDCTVFFTLSRKLEPISIFGLPLKPSRSWKMPFRRITGVHATKTIGKSKTCDIFVEANNGVVAGRVNMPYSSPIDRTLAESALGEASGIFTQFARPKNPNGEKRSNG